MSEGIEWVVTTAIALVALIGGIVVRDRQVHKAISEGDAKLYDRIAEVERSYVRRDDLNGHIEAIQNSVREMREEQRNTTKRIDELLTTLTKISVRD